MRLASDFKGPFNFSFGANYLRYHTRDKYYVFIKRDHLGDGAFQLALGGGTLPTDAAHIPFDAGVTNACNPSRRSRQYGSTFLGWAVAYIDPNPIDQHRRPRTQLFP